MCTSIVILQSVFLVLGKMWHSMRLKNLVDQAESHHCLYHCLYLHQNCERQLVPVFLTVQYSPRPWCLVPKSPFPPYIHLKSVISSSAPDSLSFISDWYVISAFDSLDDIAPLLLPPPQSSCCPLLAFLTISWCKDWSERSDRMFVAWQRFRKRWIVRKLQLNASATTCGLYPVWSRPMASACCIGVIRGTNLWV